MYFNTTFLKKNSNSILVLSILFFLTTIFFGVDFTDSFYHLSYAKSHYGDKINFFVVLSVYLVKFFSLFTSNYVIVYRFIGIMIIISTFITPLFVLKKEDNDLKKLLAAFLLVIYSPFVFNILGYDTFSAFFIVLTYTIFYKFYFTIGCDKRLVYVLSVLTAFSILCRFPNILIILVLLFGIYLKQDLSFKTKINYIFQYLLLVGLTLVLFYYFNYGNIESLFESQAINKSHNLSKLLYNYINDFIIIILYVIIISLILFLLRIRHQFPDQKTQVIFSIIVLSISYFLAKEFILFEAYSKDLALFYTAFCLVMTLISSVDLLFKENNMELLDRKKHYGQTLNRIRRTSSKINVFLFSNEFAFFLVTASFFFINAIGSNTGLFKSSHGLPILILIFFTLNEKNKKLIFIFLILLLPLSMFEHLKTYEDGLMYKTTSEVPVSKLNFIYTTPKRSNTINKVLKMTDSLKVKGYKIGYYGTRRHIFEYHTNEYLFDNASFKQTVNDSIKDMNTLISADKMAVFIVENYPSKYSKIKENSIFIKQLKSLKFNVMKKGKLIIALRNAAVLKN